MEVRGLRADKDRPILCFVGSFAIPILASNDLETTNNQPAVADTILDSMCDFLDFLEKDSHDPQAPCSASASTFLRRVFTESNAYLSSLVVALLYLQRLQEVGVDLNASTTSSLVLVALMTASKFLEDGCPRNSFWARVGRVTVTDMKVLEREFLNAIQFRLGVTPDQFSEVANELIKFRMSNYRCSSRLAMRFRFSESSDIMCLSRACGDGNVEKLCAQGEINIDKCRMVGSVKCPPIPTGPEVV